MEGAWTLEPKVFHDERGSFHEWFRGAEFREATGYDLALRQANLSVSRWGVVRGVHFADVPPGQAKYVTCVRGAVLDVVVDLRVGSPTFAQWEAVRLDDDTRHAVFVSEGLGHAFMALTDEATVVATLVRPWFENTYDGFHGHFYTPPAARVGGEVAAGWSGRRAQIAFGAFTGFHRSGAASLTELVRTLLEAIQPERLLHREELPAVVKLDLAEAAATARHRRFLHVRTGRATPRGAMDVVIDPGRLPAGHEVTVAGEYSRGELLPDGPAVPVRVVGDRTVVTLPEVVGHAVVGLA